MRRTEREEEQNLKGLRFLSKHFEKQTASNDSSDNQYDNDFFHDRSWENLAKIDTLPLPSIKKIKL